MDKEKLYQIIDEIYNSQEIETRPITQLFQDKFAKHFYKTELITEIVKRYLNGKYLLF